MDGPVVKSGVGCRWDAALDGARPGHIPAIVRLLLRFVVVVVLLLIVPLLVASEIGSGIRQGTIAAAASSSSSSSMVVGRTSRWLGRRHGPTLAPVLFGLG